MDVEDLRLAVYRSFASTGRAAELTELAAAVDAREEDVRTGLRALAEQRHLVLDDADNIVMAHPFSAMPSGFSVMGSTTLWWGGCCWDAFALGHLLPAESDVLVATRCPGCDAAGAWVVNREAAPEGDRLAHFLVPVAHMWDDVVHTCSHQRLFCSVTCIDAWCSKNGHNRGFVMNLETLWKLASHWYDGRLDPGYVRREPSEAVEYLRNVGLIDAFWGTA
jgi:hypothetical protein